MISLVYFTIGIIVIIFITIVKIGIAPNPSKRNEKCSMALKETNFQNKIPIDKHKVLKDTL